MSDAAILVLGGGTRLPKRLLDLGVPVIFAGRPSEFTAAHQESCTEAWLADLDEQAWLHRVEVVHAAVPIRQAVTVRERFLTLAARINDRFGLGGNPLTTVLALKDKALMRARLTEAGGGLLGSVRFRLLHDPADLTALVAENGLPVVVKPRDGSGSEGVTVVKDLAGLQACADRVRAAPGRFIAEEFLTGPEFSVETFSEHGRHHVLAVTEKFVGASSVEIGHVVPARLAGPDRATLAAATTEFLTAIGLQEGPAHTELILTGDGPRVVESHDRTGGDGITDLVRHAIGVDQRDLFALHLAGQPLPELGRTIGAAASWFVVGEPGTVTAVDGWGDAAASAGIVTVSADVQAGDTVRPLDGSDDRCGSVIAVGTTAQEALDRAQAAVGHVVIHVEPVHRNAVTTRLLSALGGATAWPDDPDPVRLEIVREGLEDRFLSRPVVLEQDEVRVLTDDLNGVVDLLFSLPARLFGGDLTAFAAEIGLDPVRTQLALRGPRTEPTRLSRADLYHDGSAFKLLEVNLSSALGGPQIPELNRLFLERPEFAAFAAREQLTFPDTVQHLARLITASGDSRRVALMDSPGGFPAMEPELRTLATLLRPYGIDAFACHLGQVSERDGRVLVAGRPVDLVYRYFTLGELTADPGTIRQAEQVLDVFFRAGIPILSPLNTSLYGNKAALALLWDERLSDGLDERERALLRRTVPWTRRLRTSSAELMAHCRRERVNLILKPPHGKSGKGTVLGRNLTDTQWVAHLDASDGHVVQEIVTPAPERFIDPATGQAVSWALNWGVFLIDREYAGTWIRGLPDGAADIISCGAGAYASTAFTS